MQPLSIAEKFALEGIAELAFNAGKRSEFGDIYHGYLFGHQMFDVFMEIHNRLRKEMPYSVGCTALEQTDFRQAQEIAYSVISEYLPEERRQPRRRRRPFETGE